MNPQLFILINGRPTKDKMVWQSLVDDNDVKDTVQCLKQINWLDKESISDAAKTASEQDALALNHYITRKMSECSTARCDIDHYIYKSRPLTIGLTVWSISPPEVRLTFRRYVLVPLVAIFSRSKSCQKWQLAELPEMAIQRSCQFWQLLEALSNNGNFWHKREKT